MTRNNTKALTLTLFVCCMCLLHVTANTPLILFDFEEEVDEQLITAQDASYEIITEDDNTALLVKSGFSIREPGVKLLEAEETPWELTGRYMVKADVKNVGNDYMQVEMFVGNDPEGLNRWFCSDYVDLEPGEVKTITVKMSWTPWVFEPQLKVEGMRGVPGKIKTDLAAVDEIAIISRFSMKPHTFTIDNVRIEGYTETRDTTGFFPFIDEFGQYMHKDWPGKTASVDDMKQAILHEQDYISKSPEPANRSKFGGWAAGPTLEATGYFRTEKYKDKWWLVDPEGYLFWTSGLNCMSSSYGTTGVEHRENYFKDLPDPNGEYKWFYFTSNWATHGFYADKKPYTTYAFWMSNLYKKYGNQWPVLYRDMIHKRLRSWGMNTIGFMSDSEALKQQRTPYVGSIWITGTPKIEASEGFWGKFHDVFDPGFRETVREAVERQKNGAGDPWCIGYFVDNEMSWGKVRSLALATLKSPAEQSAKIEFMNDLKKKYVNIEALNSAWKMDYSSWEDVLKRVDTPSQQAAKEDLDAFYRKIARTYFRSVNEELKRVAPNQNYLGCRFAWLVNPVVQKAAAEYCDIVSFNKYEYSVERVSLPEGVDAPIMIGEFHFGALDRGSVHLGIKEARDQAHRGELYQSYIQGALRNPQMVGAHWFQYTDQMFTGRGDGENYNVGFIDICDRPYYELIDKVRETNYQLFEYRMEN